MHRLLKLGLAAALWIALAGFAVHAQDKDKDKKEEESPAPETWDRWKYVNPGPAKSVEIGNFYLKKGKLKAALSRFEEASQTNPHYAPAQLGLGKVYERMGHKQKALDAYQHYLDELPSAKDAEDAKDAQSAVARLKRETGR